ncbi:MAG: hypothetical protein ACREPA_11850, partial [Candidatus Dormibacteraceae bacterium]
LGLPTDAWRPGAAVLHRLPMIGSAEVSGLVRGLPAGLSTPRFGLACAALARAVVARYRELEP